MKMYADLQEPTRDLNGFLRENWASLPPEVQDEVAKWDGAGNQQDRNGFIVECMYAHRDKPGLQNNEARGIIAGIAFYYATSLGGLLHFRDGRGERMANAMRREMGEKGFKQPVADDPDPLPQYVPADDQTPPAQPEA